MRCDRIDEALHAVASGRASRVQSARVRLHVLRCASCREALEQARTLSSLLAELPAPSLAPERRRAVLEAFAAAVPGPGPTRAPVPTPKGWKLWVGSVGALTAALAYTVLSLPATEVPHGWLPCLRLEIISGLVSVVVFGLATRRPWFWPPRELAALGTLGGFVALTFACGAHQPLDHVLTWHVGGMVLGTMLGALAGRLPVLPLRAASS